MIEQQGDYMFGIDRIVVAVDTSTENVRSLEAAADFAALLQAELFALFVDNPELERLEKLSSSRKINLPQGFGTSIDPGSIQRELQAHASRARQLLARASDQRRLEWSFERVRGSIREHLDDYSGQGDLVVAESAGRALGPGLRMEPSTRSAVESIERPILYLQRGPVPTRSVVAVYDDSPEAEAVLDAALHLVGGPVSLLTVLLPAEDRERADELQDRAEETLTAAGVPAHFRRINPHEVEWVVDAIEDLHGDLLIQSAHAPFLKDRESTEHLLDELDCPVLMLQ